MKGFVLSAPSSRAVCDLSQTHRPPLPPTPEGSYDFQASEKLRSRGLSEDRGGAGGEGAECLEDSTEAMVLVCVRVDARCRVCYSKLSVYVTLKPLLFRGA